jgi:exonuclease SbcC
LEDAKKQHDKVMAWERKVGLAFNTLRTISDEIASVHQINLDKKKAALSGAMEKWQQQGTQLEECNPVLQALTGIGAIDRNSIRESKNVLDKVDQEYKLIEKKIEAWEKDLKSLEPELNQLREIFLGLKYDIANLQNNAKAAGETVVRLKTALVDITGGLSAEEFQQKLNTQVLSLQQEISGAKLALDAARLENQEAENTWGVLKAGLEKTRVHLNNVRESLQTSMNRQGFSGTDELMAALLSEEQQQAIQKHLDEYAKARDFVARTLQEVDAKIKDKPFDQEQIDRVRLSLVNIQQEYEEAVREQGALEKSLNDLKTRQSEWQRLQLEIYRLAERRELAVKLVGLLKGRKLVQFLAEEHLRDMAAEASVRLAGLTGHRYALELDEGCNFVMRDDYNAGQRRPVNTLSGGETFLTSLSLALALSSKIQLKGQFPLGFFFLDEGFGTLDPEKLEVVVNTLEKLHDGQRVVGIITHVPELRSRMPRYLEISAAKIDGTGSKVVMKKS